MRVHEGLTILQAAYGRMEIQDSYLEAVFSVVKITFLLCGWPTVHADTVFGATLKQIASVVFTVQPSF